ncbi:hypothetical protein T492DRAFT_838195 [Pavlovales sp. CCMP2436]|nr:hypothetical protein T492DRAFT_838195 [Pavlovales sp. CCMP2436]
MLRRAVCISLLVVVFEGVNAAPETIVGQQEYVDYLNQGSGIGANCPLQLNFAPKSLTGSIPSEVGAFANLNSLHNLLEGPIPPIFGLMALKGLALDDNLLTGMRTDCLALSACLLTGPLPRSIKAKSQRQLEC